MRKFREVGLYIRAMSKRSSLADRLYQLRLAKGLTQKELAEPDYTHAYVSTIEAGRRQPSTNALAHFAKKLGVSVEELETGRSPGLANELRSRLHDARFDLSNGDYREADAKIKAVRREAKGLGFVVLEAQALEFAGLLQEVQGFPDEAIDRYDEALELLQQEPPTMWAYATAGKARCLQAKGESHFAIHLIQTLLARLEKANLSDPTARAWLLGPLVLALFDVGMRGEAGKLAREGLELVQVIGNGTAAASLLVNVARVHQQRGDYAQATEALNKAEDVYRTLDFKTELAVAQFAKGYVESRSGDLSAARRDLIAAVDVFEDTGSSLNLANATAELARVERLSGDLKTAERHLKRSIDVLADREDPRVLAWSKRELALVYAQESPRKAEALFKEAIELYSTTSEVVELAHTHRHYGDFLLAQGRDKKGHEAHRQGLLALERGL